jgi:hypothetical protein
VISIAVIVHGGIPETRNTIGREEIIEFHHARHDVRITAGETTPRFTNGADGVNVTERLLDVRQPSNIS